MASAPTPAPAPRLAPTPVPSAPRPAPAAPAPKKRRAPSAKKTAPKKESRGHHVDLLATNTVSWKSLVRARKAERAAEGPTPNKAAIPSFDDLPVSRSSQPALPTHNPLASVIAKIEGMYGNAQAESDSDDREEDEASAGAIGTDQGGSQAGSQGHQDGGAGGITSPSKKKKKKKKGDPNDHYDHDDPFIDDEEVVQYIQRSKAKTKHDGFFINRGKLETQSGNTDSQDNRSTVNSDDFKPKKKIIKKKTTKAKK